MKIPSILLLTISALSSLAQANALDNGDFEYGLSSWKGDRKITEEAGNKVGYLVAKKKDQSFYQKVRVDDESDLQLKFRVKYGDDYSGRGFSIFFVREDGSWTYFDRSAKAGEWTEHSLKYRYREDALEIIKVVAYGNSDGEIYFDDFVLTEK